MKYKVIEINNKVKFYKNITNVIKKVAADGTIEYEVHYSDGSYFKLSYKEGCKFEDIHFYQYDKNEKYRGELTPRTDIRGARTINRENVSIFINEMIFNFDRLSRGLPALVGDYNHHYLAAWAGDNEIYSINSGEVISKAQNQAHKTLALRIEKITGLRLYVPSYGPMYSLLGLNTETYIGKQKFKSDVSYYITQGLLKEVN